MKLEDYDIYYWGKKIENILKMECDYKWLTIKYIDNNGEYQSVSEHMSKFIFKPKEELKENKTNSSEEEKVKLALKLDLSKELREDSIAHKIKNYFELDTYQNSMLFKYDRESKKLLVSKEQLIYLLSLCNDVECQADYDMEIVDKI